MDLNQLFVSIISKFLDSLKTSNRLLWLIIGSVVIAAETFLASPASPVSVPPGIITILSSIALLFNNPRTAVKAEFVKRGDYVSDYGHIVSPSEKATPGDYIDGFLAKAIDALKTKPVIYLAIITVLAVAKFVFTDGGLKINEQVLVAVLSIIQFVMAPRTSQYVAPEVQNGIESAPNINKQKTRSGAKLKNNDQTDDSGNDIISGIGGQL